MKTHLLSALLLLSIASCTGPGQFSEMRTEAFSTTRISENANLAVRVANPSTVDEQHLLAVGFDAASNSEGHFRIDSILVGDQPVAAQDIVIPPGSVLKLNLTYSPLSLETTLANYGEWVTGVPERFEPIPVGEEAESEMHEAIHRSLLHFVYDAPREGILYVQLVGRARPGPEGEVAVSGPGGECIPGDGVACYRGGFAIDIPKLLPGGPKDLIMTGPVRLGLADGAANVRMDDFPPVIMYLRSTEISQLPSGVTATMVISGAPGKVAEGTFDGSRLELKGVAFRIRVALGELEPEQISPGLSAIVDFVIDGLTITTLEPLSRGEIALRLETTLSKAPTGNALFDQFLGGAKVIVFMRGELAL